MSHLGMKLTNRRTVSETNQHDVAVADNGKPDARPEGGEEPGDDPDG